MGKIEISDGISTRTIRTSALSHPIRIEAAAPGGPRVIVPEGVSVEHLKPAE